MYDEDMATKKEKFMILPVWVYVIGLIFFIYLFTQILTFSAQVDNNLFVSAMQFIDFGVHEASHLVVFFLPPILVAAAGSIGEIGFTVLLLIATIRSRSYFATAFTTLWIMLAMRSVGQYMADAKIMAIPLMGPGETVKHDWNFVFGQLGLLDSSTTIGGVVVIIGMIIGIIGLLLGVSLIIAKLVTWSKSKTTL